MLYVNWKVQKNEKSCKQRQTLNYHSSDLFIKTGRIHPQCANQFFLEKTLQYQYLVQEVNWEMKLFAN